jgi:hypothetical protein
MFNWLKSSLFVPRRRRLSPLAPRLHRCLRPGREHGHLEEQRRLRDRGQMSEQVRGRSHQRTDEVGIWRRLNGRQADCAKIELGR